MSVQSEIDRIITAVGNAYSKVSEKGGTVPSSQTVSNLATAIDSIPSSGAKETWVIKDNAPVDENSYELAKTNISFASAGAKFVALEICTDDDVVWRLKYYTTANQAIQVGSCDLGLEEDRFYWKNNAYKKLTFDTPPTGALLTWLQSNAVKQPDDTAVQDNKALTITSNGTVSVTPDAPYDGLSSVDVTVDVAGSGGGGASAKWDDVTFIDYDGSVLYSYSLAEAQALTELPALPSHDGLVCQGWNWTLEAIKALNRPVTVGAMYITDDGATRLHIRIATVGRMTVPLYIGQTVANGVSIDWGDGSAVKTLPGTGNVDTSHTYAEPGDYVISLMPQDGCTLSFGRGSRSYCVMGSTGNNGMVYCNMLQDVSIGKNVTTIGNYAFRSCYSLVSITIPTRVTTIGQSVFQSCYSLASITIPDGVTSISDSAFSSCYSLASITIPTGVTSIGSYVFKDCYSLASITIPTGVTSIGDYAFQNCYSLASITIPTGVTSIEDYAFYNCFGMRYYDFSACTAIPALSGSNAFKNNPSDFQMLIPSALYNNWKAATNWVFYASKMVSV